MKWMFDLCPLPFFDKMIKRYYAILGFSSGFTGEKAHDIIDDKQWGTMLNQCIDNM